MKTFAKNHLLPLLIVAASVVSMTSCSASDAKVPVQEEEGQTPVVTRSLTSDLKELAKNTPFRMWICAHRSNTYRAKLEGIPENSVPAVEYAIEAGLDMIEVDARATKDGVIVNVHNETVDATTNGTGKVSSYTYEQLCALRLKGSKGTTTYQVPTFKEMLEAAKDKIYVCVDVKEAILLPQMFQIVEELGMKDQVCYFAGTAAKPENSDMVANNGAILFPWVSSAANVKTLAERYGEKLVFIQFDMGSSALSAIVSAADSYGMTGFANHLTTSDTALLGGNYSYLEAFITNKVEMVQTDYGDLMTGYLKEKNVR